MASENIWATLCFCIVCIFPSIILILFSIHHLEQTEWGLDYNGITKSIERHHYGQGLHFTGLFHSFKRFPNTYQNIKFSSGRHDLLQARTNDGLSLTLGLSFQYKLIPDKLYDLYMNYKEDYKSALIAVAANSIANVASEYSTYDFFEKKKQIGQSMLESLIPYVKEHLFIEVIDLQIMLTDLPDIFEDAIQKSIAIKQNITNTEKVKDYQEIAFATEVMIANKAAQQTIIKAKGDSSTTLIKKNATAEMVKRNLTAQNLSYGLVKDNLELETSELMEYIWWDSMAVNQGNSNYIIGIDPSTMIRA